MLEIKVGDIAISLCGHDKGQKYLIIKIVDDILYLCDGEKKMIAHPKKKKNKHVQIIKTNIDINVVLKTNESIKFFLKTYGGNNV